ncbi:hypothetical protein DL95DRAFT_417670 [Leptodontidium sp. 2 PMI_412]|nr:hypothetical protein DL95DRAFT_417670 [Leptodontidium sp. 2 PMI_412]
MGQFTLAPTCSICLASTYSEFGPDRENPEFNEWLSKVRLIINKDVTEHIGDNIRNGLNHLPVDVEGFQWSQDIILTPRNTATSYFEYEIDRINFRWSEPGHETAEPPTLRQQEWDLDDGVDHFKSIHESCFTLLVDMLKEYTMRNGIEGRCSAKSLWQCLCDIDLVEDDSVPNIADLSWQTFLFRPEERDLWKFANPLPLDQERQNTIARALEQIIQIKIQHPTPPVLGIDLELLRGDSWSSQWQVLKQLLPHFEFDETFLAAPSLRNRIRISQRIEEIIPQLLVLESNRKTLAAEQSPWAGSSFTLGLPESEDYLDLFIHNSVGDRCDRIQACVMLGSNDLAGVRFWYPPSSQSAASTSRTLGTWYESQESMNFKMKGRIAGVVMSFVQTDRYKNGSQKRSLTVVGLKEGRISQILLLEANLDKTRAPRTQNDLNSLYRSLKPLLRTSWPSNMPSDLTIEKGIGMDSQRYRLDRTEIIVISPSDPILKIQISATDASIEFITSSGSTQRFPCTLGSSAFPATPAFEIDSITEKIISIQLTYINYYDTEFPTLDPWQFHGRVAEPELVDVVFTTNLGRSSGEVRKKGFGVGRDGYPLFTFVLDASDGGEIGGVYAYGYSCSTMFYGLFTRKGRCRSA